MKKAIIVDPGPVGQALKMILELKGGMEVCIVKNEDEFIDALASFPAEMVVIGAMNDKDLAEFARVNARPGQRVKQFGWDENPVQGPDPSYVRLPILGDGIVKLLTED